MQRSEHGKKKHEQRRDAGKASQVKTAQADLGEFSPASKCCRSNQEAGRGEENLNAIMAVPDKRADELTRQTGGVRKSCLQTGYAYAVHEHKANCNATNKTPAINSCA